MGIVVTLNLFSLDFNNFTILKDILFYTLGNLRNTLKYTNQYTIQ